MANKQRNAIYNSVLINQHSEIAKDGLKIYEEYTRVIELDNKKHGVLINSLKSQLTNWAYDVGAYTKKEFDTSKPMYIEVTDMGMLLLYQK